jgi:hypothetical protein
VGACTDIRGCGLINRTGVIMSWSIGFTRDGEQDTILDDNVQFVEGIHNLYESVQKAIQRAESEESDDMYGLEVMLADILDIKDDAGIMEDPDQWEDWDFFGPEVTYWIVLN